MFWFCLFPNSKYRSRQQILVWAKTQELGVNLQRSSCCYTISACNSDCLMTTLLKSYLFLRVKTVTNEWLAVIVNPWGDHCALPLTVRQELLSLRFPLASENSLYRTCMVIPIVATAWSWSLAWCLCFSWVQKIATVSQLNERCHKSDIFFSSCVITISSPGLDLSISEQCEGNTHVEKMLLFRLAWVHMHMLQLPSQ